MSPRYCDHQFYTHMLASNIGDCSIIICAFCGQVRHLFHDGTVKIIREEGEVKKAYVNTINTNNKTA